MHASLPDLIRSSEPLPAGRKNKDARVWNKASSPPVTLTTCVSIHDRLLVVGGQDSNKKPTTAIHVYNSGYGLMGGHQSHDDTTTRVCCVSPL